MKSIALLPIILISCTTHASTTMVPQTVALTDAQYVDVLMHVPDWTGMNGKITAEDGRTMMHKFEPFLKLSPMDLKRIGLLYNDKVRNGLISDPILILLDRAYFDLPMSVKYDDKSGTMNPYFGGVTKEFSGLPMSNQSALWPVGVSNGKLVVTGTCSGSGPLPFLFINEFDMFSKLYKRRIKID